MIKGVGIDMVHSGEISRLVKSSSTGVLKRIFTEKELAISKAAPDPVEYLSTRYAAKEAVFKAVAQLLPEKIFDYRIVETLNREDGSPYINITPSLRAVLDSANVSEFFVSISTEGEFAISVAIAV